MEDELRKIQEARQQQEREIAEEGVKSVNKADKFAQTEQLEQHAQKQLDEMQAKDDLAAAYFMTFIQPRNRRGKSGIEGRRTVW